MNLTKEQRIAKHKDFLKANWQALAAFSWEHYKSDQFCLAIPRWVQKCSLGIFKNWKIAARSQRNRTSPRLGSPGAVPRMTTVTRGAALRHPYRCSLRELHRHRSALKRCSRHQGLRL
jgi:hypothetical protein